MANIVRNRKFHLPPGDEEVEWAPPAVRKYVPQLDRRPVFERKSPGDLGAEGSGGSPPATLARNK